MSLSKIKDLPVYKHPKLLLTVFKEVPKDLSFFKFAWLGPALLALRSLFKQKRVDEWEDTYNSISVEDRMNLYPEHIRNRLQPKNLTEKWFSDLCTKGVDDSNV